MHNDDFMAKVACIVETDVLEGLHRFGGHQGHQIAHRRRQIRQPEQQPYPCRTAALKAIAPAP